MSSLEQGVFGLPGRGEVGQWLPLTGGKIDGPLYLDRDPTDRREATTKDYVDTRPIILPASVFGAVRGSPTMATLNGTWRYWSFDDSTDQLVDTAIVVPDGWRSLNLEVYWFNATSATGGVSLQSHFTFWGVSPGGTLSSFSTLTFTTQADGENVLKRTTVDRLDCTPGELRQIGIGRKGDSIGDTKTGAAGVLAVVVKGYPAKTPPDLFAP